MYLYNQIKKQKLKAMYLWYAYSMIASYRRTMDKKDKKICLRMNEEFHREIKIISAMTRSSINEYVLKAIALKLLNDKRMLK